MEFVGSFDKEVGIEYSLEKSTQSDTDIWFTDEEFSYYIGPVANQRYVTVPKGFFTDGASVPRIFWAVFPPWGSYGQAAIVHDYLCVNKTLTKNGDNPNLSISQSEIDRVLYDAMKISGVPVWKRVIIYNCVRLWHNLGI